MNKELADEVIALGIGSKHVDRDLYDWSNAWSDAWQKDRMCKMNADQFITDPRVAMAMAGKVDAVYLEKLTNGGWQAQATMDCMPTDWHESKSKSLAITTACIAALRETT